MNSKLLTDPSGMSVELLSSMNSDIDIVNAARVSYGKQSSLVFNTPRILLLHEQPAPFFVPNRWKKMSKKDTGLIGYLMKNHHGTPFEMIQFQFRVYAPIGVVWEWVRHRMSSFNVKSTRYTEWTDDYYFPEDAQIREQIGKPGHYEFVPITDEIRLNNIKSEYSCAMENAFNSYDRLIEYGLAKEVARNVLPMGAMTEFIWSVNLRSLFNFLYLRTDSHALEEIQIAARMVESLAENVAPLSFEAWRKNDKRAP